MYNPKNKYLCIVVFLLMMILLVSSLGSCTPRASALLMEGQIIDTDQDRILVIFRDVADKPHSFGYSWFYYPYAYTLKGEHYVQVVVKERRQE